MTSRCYIWRLSNYTINDQVRIYEIFKKQEKDNGLLRYICYGREVGEKTGTIHLQGYMEIRSPIRATQCKKIFTDYHESFSRIHIEPKIKDSTREQARNYTKKEGKWIEFGNWKEGGQGTRNDITDAMNSIKKNVEENPMDATLNMMEEHPMQWAKYGRFLEKYQALYEKKMSRGFRKIDVVVNYGDAGVGKTKEAVEYCAMKNEYPFMANSDETFIFDGYDGEKTLVIDDFKGQIKYKQLLRVLDGYQYRCNVKGSHRYARWDKVFITANDRPDEWYKYGLTPALSRRLTIVKHSVKPSQL